MTYKGAIKQLYEMRDNIWMPEFFKPYFDKIIETLTADVRENVQLDVCPLYGGACGYPSGECYDCPRHGNFRENVRGEWIKLDDEPVYIIECSECGDKLLNMIGQPVPKFCSNCGADMRHIGEHDRRK